MAHASETLLRQNMSEHWGSGGHANLFIIYALSGVLQSSEYPKKSLANHLVPDMCFPLGPETFVFLL